MSAKLTYQEFEKINERHKSIASNDPFQWEKGNEANAKLPEHLHYSHMGARGENKHE